MPVLIQRMRALLGGLAVLYCLAMVTLALAWAAGIPRPWWLELANIFALYLFSPLLLLVPLAFVVRSGWLRAATAGLVVTFVALFGWQLVPPAVGEPAGRPLRVLTFNVQRAGSSRDIASLVSFIQSQNPDIVTLQEVSETAKAALADSLGGAYPYQLLIPPDRRTGLALLSRYPLEMKPSPLRYAQWVTADVDGAAVTVINVSMPTPEIHPGKVRGWPEPRLIANYTTARRSAALAALLQMIDSVQGPLIVAGDFNLSEREAGYSQLARRLDDAYRDTQAGFGFTFPHNKRIGPLFIPFPLIRIDYIWSAGGAAPAAAEVICHRPVSDHCAVRADLKLGRGGP